MKEDQKVFSRTRKPSLRRRRHSEPLNAIVSLRISDDELILLRRLGRKKRLSASEILRDALHAVLQRVAEAEGREPGALTTSPA